MSDSPHYMIETMRMGNYVKVTAIDPETGMEAVVIGPLQATQRDLTKLAINKLKLALKKT